MSPSFIPPSVLVSSERSSFSCPSPISRIAESPVRRQVHAALRDIALRTKSLQIDEFSLQQLKNLNGHVNFSSLDEDSPHKPSYFAPYPGHLIPEPSDDALGESYNGVDDETEHSFTRPVDRAYVMDTYFSGYISYCDVNVKGERVPWFSKCVGESPFQVSGLYKDEYPEFGCYHITELKDYTYPHDNNLAATDSTILYGVLMPILRIMLTQLRRPRFIHQMVTPVLIFWFMGVQARVIEAFFQGQSLVLRPTKMYDFSHGNPDAFKKFAQWYMGKPTGGLHTGFLLADALSYFLFTLSSI